MSTMFRAPHRVRLIWPHAYRATMANPFRWPRPVILRSSCGHMLGVGYAWRHQGYLAWRRCS